MDERVRFVGRLLDGEKMAALCREFAISRKTGYKIFDRYKEHGLEALTDRSRRPWRYANQLPQQVETAILHLKREKPYWGARKIRERLLRRFSCEVKVPARSTIHAVLDRHGLVQRRRRRRHPCFRAHRCRWGSSPTSCGAPTTKASSCWATEKYCYPLTVTDHASRYLLLVEALGMKCPAEVYTPATRRYRGLPELAYPFHDRVIHVTNCGRICLHRKKINLSTVFAGQAVGIKEVDDGIWLVSFMDYDLGYIDLEEKTLQPLNNPFGPKV